MSLILKLNNLIEGEVIKRPSKYIKTPYVADIKICSTSNMILGHTASLGCCGLADVGAAILMAPVPKIHKFTKNPDKLHCEYRVYLSVIREKEKEIIVGIYPKLAEELTESALKNNLLSRLINIKTYKKETKIYVPGLVDSRFDFTGIDQNGIPFIMEVKNVPLADYEDVTSKDRKKMSFDDRDINSKVAYFPDGYRKKSTDPVSPRALKHINELALIKRMSKTRCIMCYVIQRSDVVKFQTATTDPEYKAAVKKAHENGVEIITLCIDWSKAGTATFVCCDLPFKL